MSALITWPAFTPRMFSICERETGWRQAMIASVSIDGRERTVARPLPSIWRTHGPQSADVRKRKPPFVSTSSKPSPASASARRTSSIAARTSDGGHTFAGGVSFASSSRFSISARAAVAAASASALGIAPTVRPAATSASACAASSSASVTSGASADCARRSVSTVSTT